MIFLTSFIICSLQAVHVQFHTRAVCLMCVCVFVRVSSVPWNASPCQRTLPVASHLVSLLWTYPVLHLLWPQETYHCVQRATLRHFGSLDISPLCILSSFLLQMLCSGQCCASHPGMAFLDTFSLIPWFLPGCHPAGSLPPFQLGCSRASWHQLYLLSVSTNFPSCLSY